MRSGRARPLLSGQQKVGKDWPKRAAPPLGFPLAFALECLRHNRARGRRNPPPLRGEGLPRRIAWALPQFMMERTPVRCAQEKET